MSNNKKGQNKDYVVGLISGRMVNETDKEGKTTSVFQPQLKNKHPRLHDVFRHEGLTKSEDQIMSEQSLRYPALYLDKSIYMKTESEKLRLKRMKSENKQAILKAGLNPRKCMNADLQQILHK